MGSIDPPDFDALWDYNRPAETEARFRALYPSIAGDSIAALELQTQIARAQGLQRRFDEANATLDGVEKALLPDQPRLRVRYLLERGRVVNSSGNPHRARPLFEEALVLAAVDPASAFYAVDAAHMLAIVSEPEEALKWNLRALAIAESAGDERARRWRGSLLNNIGWTYHASGDYPVALDYLQQALAFRREFGPDDEFRIARWCVARVMRDVGQVGEALAEQRVLMDEYEALGEPSGYVHEEIGECLRLMGNVAEARPHFAQAYRLLSADRWLAANEQDRLERLRLLGEA